MIIKRNALSETHPHVLITDSGQKAWMTDAQLYLLKEKLDTYILRMEEIRNGAVTIC